MPRGTPNPTNLPSEELKNRRKKRPTVGRTVTVFIIWPLSVRPVAAHAVAEIRIRAFP